MAVYSMVNAEVHDADAYGEYAKLAGPAVEKFGGKFLARGGKMVVKEGSPMPRAVIIEWPDMATAEAFYDSPEYQEALSHGLPASTRNYWFIEGV